MQRGTTYNSAARKTGEVVPGILAVLGLVMCCAQTVTIKQSSLMLGGAIAALLAIPLITSLVDVRARRTMARTINDCRTEYEAVMMCIIHIGVITAGIGNRSDEMKQVQLVEQHCVHCKDPSCPLSAAHKLGGDSKISGLRRVGYLCFLVRKCINKFPNSVDLRILEIILLLDCSKDGLVAWVRIRSLLGSDKLSFFDAAQLENYKYFPSLSHNINRDRQMVQREIVDTSYLRREVRDRQLWSLNLSRLRGKFHARIIRAAEMYVRWWNLLLEPAPDLNAFRELGAGIQKKIEQAKKLWHTFVRTGSVSAAVLGVYTRFYGQLLGDVKKAERLREKHGEALEAKAGGNSEFDQKGCDEGIVEVSAKSTTRGEVVGYNRAFSQITGYLPGELLKTNLTTIMPEIYREAHSKAMGACCVALEFGEEYDMQRKFASYLLDKGRHLVPVRIKIVDLPHFVNGYSLVAGVSRTHGFGDYGVVHLLVDPGLLVTAVSSSMQINGNMR